MGIIVVEVEFSPNMTNWKITSPSCAQIGATLLIEEPEICIKKELVSTEMHA